MITLLDAVDFSKLHYGDPIDVCLKKSITY